MLDSAAVDQIVANVLKQLSASSGGVRTPAISLPRNTTDSRLPLTTDQPSTATLTERVITGDILAEKAQGATQVIIPEKAILTPTANDFLKVNHVQIIRSAGTVKARSGDVSLSTWKLITVTSTPASLRLSGELTTGWSREILGCPDDAASLAISAICRGESGGVVILSQQHFRAACRANRNDKVRAVPVSCPADVITARKQLRLNVIAIDPTNRSYYELKNILGAFTKDQLSVTREDRQQ